MSMNLRQDIGRYGEERAAIYLEDHGYEIIERNWRSGSGEIDLIARQKDRLVFVEVKTRNGSGYGHPFEAITQAKVSRMRRLVAEWCATKKLPTIKVRLDAISVLITGGRVFIEHLKEVF
jgi:putative endonuclease